MKMKSQLKILATQRDIIVKQPGFLRLKLLRPYGLSVERVLLNTSTICLLMITNITNSSL